ncbi:Astra associated protein 1 Asa1 [Rhodotorula kratochvilovae]
MLSSLSSSSSSSRQGAPSPPAPEYLLRGHAAPVAVLRFSRCARFLFSGDTDGFVAVWDLRTFRPRYFWRAHEGGILGLEEVDGALLTQGRDNLLRLYRFPAIAAAAGTVDYGAATAVPSTSAPSEGVERVWSLDINAMNFCRMSVCSLGVRATGKGKEREVDEEGGEEALVAVPSLTKDDFVDIFHYPSETRVHRSVGEGAFVGQKTGTVMALHLFYLPPPVPAAPPAASDQPTAPAPSSSSAPPPPPPALHLLIAYESGQLALFRFAPTRGFSLAPSYPASSSSPTAPPLYLPRPGVHISASEGWELVWVEKGHRDAVMSLAVTPDNRFAYTAGADHHLVAYRISDSNDAEAARPRSHTELTTSAGHAGVAVRADGKVVATAGWDGEARIHHAKTLAPLAVLSHHRTSLQALAFAPLSPARSALPFSSTGGDDSDEGEGAREGRQRAWLATGGQEAKIALWEVYPPRDKKVARRRGSGRGA